MQDCERKSVIGIRRELRRVCGLRDQVQFGEIEAVVINSKRRLARDFDETVRLMLDLREHGVESHTYYEGILDLRDLVQAAVEVLQAASEHKAKRRRSSDLDTPAVSELVL